jgi:dihydropyrimidinase
MTYDRLRLGDEQLLDVLAAARRLGALTMIHAENHGMIAWLSNRLLHAGATAPRYHAIAHPRVAEGEAVQRAIALAELVDVPILIVHVSDAAGADAIRRAQTRASASTGRRARSILFLTGEDLDRPGWKARSTAAARRPGTGRRSRRSGEASRRHVPGLLVRSRTLPLRRVGEAPEGRRTTFKDMANGVPGIELRLPLLFSEGVGRAGSR